MAGKRYRVLVQPETTGWEVHAMSCPDGRGENRQLIKLDLEEWEDEELLGAVDSTEQATIEDLYLCACTGYSNDLYKPAAMESEPTPAPSPQPTTKAAAASREAAAARLLQQVEETIDKLVAARGVDNVGEGDRWAGERLPSCTDDYVYDLAVEVRKLRARGEAWWRVAYELGLPGSGASNKQGRKGSAFARRLWRAAWGKTYLGERSPRDSKITREARAMENQGRPYFDPSVTDQEIIDAIVGQEIHWVVRLGGKHGLITSAQETFVHDDNRLVKVKQGPQGRYVEFFEQLDPAMLKVDPRRAITKSGPLRAVYVDRITRVGV